MHLRFLRSLLVAASFLLPTVAAAQVPTVRPTREQAQVLLQTRPDLVEQLRQRFATSGLTRDQVHARLRAEGYPEDLLDPYLPGMTGDAPPPSNDVFAAVRALGIADSSDVNALQAESEALTAQDIAPSAQSGQAGRGGGTGALAGQSDEAQTGQRQNGRTTGRGGVSPQTG